MTDIFPPQKRSEIMSKVKSRNTKPEIWVRTFLFSLGFRYRKNDKRYAGTPDLVLPKYKTIIFIHGCNQSLKMRNKETNRDLAEFFGNKWDGYR